MVKIYTYRRVAFFCALTLHFFIQADHANNPASKTIPVQESASVKKSSQNTPKVNKPVEKPHHSLIRRGLDKIAVGFDRILRALGLSEPVKPVNLADK